MWVSILCFLICTRLFTTLYMIFMFLRQKICLEDEAKNGSKKKNAQEKLLFFLYALVIFIKTASQNNLIFVDKKYYDFS